MTHATVSATVSDQTDIAANLPAVVEQPRAPTPNQLERLPNTGPAKPSPGQAGEYIGISLAGGLVIGLVIGALMPRSPGRKLTRHASVLAGVAGDVVLALARQAINQADGTGQEANKKWHEASGKFAQITRTATAQAKAHAEQMAHEAADFAAKASNLARKSGLTIAEKAIKRITKTSR